MLFFELRAAYLVLLGFSTESFAIAFCRKETMTTIGYGVSDPLLGSGDSARKVLTERNEQFQCKIDKDCGRICSVSVDGKGENWHALCLTAQDV